MRKGFSLRERGRRYRHPDRGAAAVEFALVATLFLMLVFGIIGFGMVFAQELSLSNGARQAARAGVVADRQCSEVYTEARSGAKTINLDPSNVVVEVKRGLSEAAAATRCVSTSGGQSSDVACEDSAPGDNLYVYTRFTSEVMVPLLPITGSFPLEGKGVFRCEFS
jgi:Flp pilus assembly protein TadG